MVWQTETLENLQHDGKARRTGEERGRPSTRVGRERCPGNG